MNRPTEHQTAAPGKFEGESCIARFAHNVILNGFADYDDPESIEGPFTLQDVEQFEKDTQDQMCQDCIDVLVTLQQVSVWEDSQGFVWANA